MHVDLNADLGEEAPANTKQPALVGPANFARGWRAGVRLGR